MDIRQMMKQASNLQSKMQEIQKKMEDHEVVGESGGGLVKVTMTAKKEIKKVWLDPSIVVASDKDMLEDLIVAACMDGGRKANELVESQMNGLGIPPEFLKMAL